MNRKIFLFVISIGLLGAAGRAQQPEAISAGRDGASFVSQAVPSTIGTEEIVPVSVVMKNTGATTWDSSYGLATRGYAWAVRRILLADGDTVPPGSSKTFSFSVTAPSEVGPYFFQWTMVTRKRSFGERTPRLLVAVKPSASGNDAKFVSQKMPALMVKGTPYPVTVTMRNTGTTTWTAAAGYALDYEPAFKLERPVRIALDPSDSIAPGGLKTFSFMLEGPGDRERLRWRMIRAGKQLFGEKSRLTMVRNPAFRGFLDNADCQVLAGWAADARDYGEHLKVAIFADEAQFAMVEASRFRADLAAARIGKGDHSFEIQTPAFLLDGKAHSIGAFVVPSDDFELLSSTKSITCAAPPGKARR